MMSGLSLKLGQGEVSTGARQRCGIALLLALAALPAPSLAQPASAPPPQVQAAPRPWLDVSLAPDRRAELVLAQMTQAEKLQLVHGGGFAITGGAGVANRSNGGAGFVPGIDRLGLPDLNMADSTVGVARGAARSRYATLLPATIAEAASWSEDVAAEDGALIGRELRDQGYNVSLAGGVNLMREPRNGRSFEYRGEDAVLAGKLAGRFIRAMQAQHVIGDIKHFAFNDQETGRQIGDVRIGQAAGRESDLLAFEIGIRDGDPGMVMCSYNKFGGDWACENDYLLNQVLKRDWRFKGFVLSDWGGTHSSSKALLAGLDQEQPGQTYFGQELAAALASGAAPEARLDDAARRILRTMFANGIVDHPPVQRVVDVDAGRRVALRAAEQGIVLLKNDGILPLAGSARSILVVGSHADVGVLTGGGSGQVDPPGGSAVKDESGTVDNGAAGIFSRAPVWWPSSPLAALRAELPQTRISYLGGEHLQSVAQAAAGAEIAIVFANAPATEGRDLADLSLPDRQDALIAAVAKANPRTIVVLETGGPVTMPWLADVRGVVEAWYPGAQGGEAIARLLAGTVNFSAKLPITFPQAETDLPNRVVPGSDLAEVPALGADGQPLRMRDGRIRMTKPPFAITYPEGADVGYRWFQRQPRKPLFAFGHGLAYTSYAYRDLKVTGDTASFTVTNTGDRAGREISQVYVSVPGRSRRLAGWATVELEPHQSKPVTVHLEPLAASVFDDRSGGWTRPKGTYTFSVGGASDQAVLAASVRR